MNTLVCAYPAAAQCGPAAGSGNTACGTNALQANTGVNNTATGENALTNNTGGFNNTATGWEALQRNTTGVENTATGEFALEANIIGNQNTADGKAALFNNTGSFNTATGYKALFGTAGNSTGSANTAAGYDALYSNTTGIYNTASGVDALYNNTTGNYNAASGVNALQSNTTGNYNTASGYTALYSDTIGSANTASGVGALDHNTMGSDNTASGYDALVNNTTGRLNIGLGYLAGKNIVGGSNNIDIGGSGTTDESNTIRIGVPATQRATYIAGISTAQVTGNVVEVNSNGQLGIAMSSARYKRDIRNMGGTSADLMKLRPVTFRYKNDPSGTLEYGLVAEEVQRVYPNLVTYGADGKLQSVRYLEFTALLLNELQKQTAKVTAQQHEIDTLKQKDASIDVLSERLAVLEQQMRTASSARFDSLARK